MNWGGEGANEATWEAPLEHERFYKREREKERFYHRFGERCKDNAFEVNFTHGPNARGGENASDYEGRNEKA